MYKSFAFKKKANKLVNKNSSQTFEYILKMCMAKVTLLHRFLCPLGYPVFTPCPYTARVHTFTYIKRSMHLEIMPVIA